MATTSLIARRRGDLPDHVRREFPALVVSGANAPEGHVRLAFAAPFHGEQNFIFDHRNVIYYEAAVVEREPREDELKHLRNSAFRDVPDEVVAVDDLPPLEDLHAAVADGDLDAFSNLDATIRDEEERQRVVEDLQTEIATAGYRANRLHRDGIPDSDALPPEWDPDSADKDRETLYEMQSSRVDAHKVSWKRLFGFSYYFLFEARYQTLDLYEPDLEPYDLLAMAAVDDRWKVDEAETYCRRCGAIWREELFLHVQRRGRDAEDDFRVCDHCAERWAGTMETLDGDTYRGPWTEDAVAQAQDERAERLGGQRRLVGFTTD